MKKKGLLPKLTRVWIETADYDWLIKEKKKTGLTLYKIVAIALKRYAIQRKMEELAEKRGGGRTKATR